MTITDNPGQRVDCGPASIYFGGKSVWAVCRCGWQSSRYGSRYWAQQMWAKHVLTTVQGPAA